MVEGAALEKRCPSKGDRGFESLPLRLRLAEARLRRDAVRQVERKRASISEDEKKVYALYI